MERDLYSMNLCGQGEPVAIILQPYSPDSKGAMVSLPGELQKTAGVSFLFCQFHVPHHDDHLTPWPARPMFGDRPFGGKAVETLGFLTEHLLPEIEESKLPLILGGYSLGALFALWCAYQTDVFDSVVAVSPSLWYDGWIEYASQQLPLARHIYLSLGLAESKGRNQRLASVGDNIRRQDELLNECAGVNHILEWNPGNHFTDPAGRMLRGYEWALRSMGEGTR